MTSANSAHYFIQFSSSSAGYFNGIWSDMAVESTIIRDAKGTGGVVGLTRKEPALVRWMLTRHHLAEYSSALHERRCIFIIICFTFMQIKHMLVSSFAYFNLYIYAPIHILQFNTLFVFLRQVVCE